MKTNPKLKYILVFCLGLLWRPMFAHDVKVHWAITINAAESAFDDSPAYDSFLNTVSSDVKLATATNTMVFGSGREDAPVTDIPLDEGGKRSYNHFYDPLDPTYGKGLSDGPPDIRTKIALDSFTWGSVPIVRVWIMAGF